MHTETCGICGRPLGTEKIDQHHLIPKTFKGKETVPLHKICHRKVHSVFTERELLHTYNTLESLRNHPDIVTFSAWVAKKPLDFYSGSDNTAKRRGKR